MQTERMPDQVPFNQLMAEPMQFSHQAPPVMFRLAVSSRIAPLIPALTAEVANVAGFSSRNNPIRTYIFNTISQNGWQNNHFADMVTAAAGYLDWLCIKKGVTNLYDYINHAATKAIELYGAKLALSSSVLMSYTDFNVQGMLRQNASLMDTILRDVTNSMTTQAGMTYGVPQAGMMMPMQGGMPMVNMGMPAPPVAMGQFGSPTGRVIPNIAIEQPANVQLDRYYKPDQETFVPVDVPERIVIPTKIDVYDPPVVMQEDFINTNQNKEQKSVINLGDVQIMDRSAHTITYRGVPFKGDITAREQSALDILKNTSDELKPSQSGQSVRHMENLMMAENVDSLFFEMDVRLSQYQKDGHGVEIFTAAAMLYTPILSTTVNRNAFKRMIEKTKTVETLATEIFEVISKQCSREAKTNFRLLRIYKAFDEYLTRSFNDFMQLRLDSKITITSFAEDCRQLFTYMSNNGHEALIPYMDMFLTELKSLYKFDMESLEKDIIEMMMGGSGETATLIIESIGAISIGLLYDELGYNFKVGDVYGLPAVDNTDYPFMASLNELIQKLRANSPIPVFRYYIKTLDDRMLMASESLLPDNNTTIRLLS